MTTTERFVVDVPSSLASVVRDQVSSGRFDSLSDAVTAGLEAVTDEDPELEAWIAGPLAAAYDAVEARRTTFYSSDEVKARLGIRG
ncbi:hypothetical protein ASE86_05035 [Sphingomonas sp. Leaf33]|uniref:hypothetical protein n=1 Tax=Sphingomonas sp. Leaf33 TaxID=1736215 RepID=UPI0006F95C5B|nr:hypothetical protein [Sphingomonas sp. Leaf33]KQN25582.1 hypothetical protein ASE86_05035 [Sphingomonas sp. Leaf33]